MTPRELKSSRFWMNQIITIANRQSKIEEREAENLAKTAAMASKAAKKKKKAKAKKPKTTNS